MPAPLDPAKRAAIAHDIRTSGLGRNAIAKTHGVSGSVVGKIADAEGIEDPWDRTQTERATAAKSVDMAARRVELAGLLMQDAFDLRVRMWGKQYQAVVVPRKGGGADTQIIEVPTSASDFRNYLTSIGVAVDKIGVLTRDDGSVERDAGALIGGLVDGLRGLSSNIVRQGAGVEPNDVREPGP